MSLVSGLAVYFIIWWLSLFIVLPFGVRTQAEVNDRRLGTTASAPAKAMMLRKAVATTILASVLFGLFYWAIEVQGLGPDLLSLLPMPDSLK
ncbi:DUF1467 family protein [Cohaesibacter haloalkalitolerans]|uniref:DUF1467 family protein n=1 Tax=Cohaesibacter haloalkalitolerans TaxID=1162980 RepID=UPI000E648570|nr:DUF1467 family protein [Cohaesibacter haloalkalitolerans]